MKQQNNQTMNKLAVILILLCSNVYSKAQTDTVDLMTSLPPSPGNNREFVSNAFKSSRVINGQSIEFIGKNVLDVRILHRFGYINEGAGNLFGLDEASMRMGFDYGIGNNLTIGIGRSTARKELDGFIKARLLRQAVEAGSPVTLVWVSGMTLFTTKWADKERNNLFSSRLAYYHELIIGRKFDERFSLQVSPLYVHRNLIDSVKNSNDTWALGIGGRLKVSKRIALVVDYHPILSGKQHGTCDPLSMGVDIETGGHVFQLHFSNATGMNEKEFITNTSGRFFKGDVRFGFNLSRVFSLRRKTG